MGRGKFAALWQNVVEIWRIYPGRIVILGMCLVALLAAIYAQWHLYFDSRRALEYYGPDASTLILRSSSVELFYLEPATEETKAARVPELNVLEQEFAIVKVLNIANAPGAIHARSALLSDANYDWRPTKENGLDAWQYALQFREAKSTAIVAFAPASGHAILVGSDRAVLLIPQVVRGMEQFRQSAEAQAAARAVGKAANRALQKKK
ncbi:MAG: hypothetical protein KDA42_01560 [Planctomycetales bacterium]|nr:hypothetical protein [Planctomycetales bacterium]